MYFFSTRKLQVLCEMSVLPCVQSLFVDDTDRYIWSILTRVPTKSPYNDEKKIIINHILLRFPLTNWKTVPSTIYLFLFSSITHNTLYTYSKNYLPHIRMYIVRTWRTHTVHIICNIPVSITYCNIISTLHFIDR